MKTKTIIAFYAILFLTGLAMAGFSQGIENSGGYITGTSTNFVKFSGSSDMTLKSTTANNTTFGHVAVDLAGTGTYKMTIPDDSYITVDGNLNLSDTLLLKASSSGMASLITNGTVSGSFAQVEQHIPSQDKWHIISSPVAGAQTSVYNGSYLMKWNEVDTTWTFTTSPTDPLNVTQGYFVWSSSAISSPTDVKFDGLLNTGNKTVSGLSYTTNGYSGGDGWNLIGNPYPSAIEWTSTWTKSSISATIYVYDGINYLTWNYNLGGYGTKTDGSIPSTQGFWVKATGSSPSMTIPNSERVHSSQGFYKGTTELNQLFTLRISGNNYSDVMKVGFYKDATYDFDAEYDASKLYGIDEAPQLYTIMKNNKYAVNLLQTFNKKECVPMGVRVGVAGKYIISLDPELIGFDNGIVVYLEDKKFPNTLINLKTNPEYAVKLNAHEYTKRFVLHFVKEQGPSIFPYKTDNSEENIFIYSDRNKVYVNYQSEVPADIEIYDLLGKNVLSEKLQTMQLNNFSVQNGKGYYIVQVISTANAETKKIYLN